MKRCLLASTIVLGLAFTTARAGLAPGDLALGLSRPTSLDSLQIVRGQPSGAVIPDAYDALLTQSVEFDNLGGSHSPTGNLLGINFGSAGGTGRIQWFPTGSLAGGGTVIGDTTGLGGAGLTPSRLSGLSVSPGNNRVAVAGYDGGRVYIFDYAPGDGAAIPSALSNGRQTGPGISPTLNTFGTAWFGGHAVLAFGTDGALQRINADTLAVETLATVPGLTFSSDGANSAFTDIEYNPLLSPYVFAMHGRFDGVATRNALIAFNPANWTIAGQWEFAALQSTREIALGPDGALYVSQFGGTAAGATTRIARIAGAASLDILGAATYYATVPGVPSPFSGIDIALPEPGTLALVALTGIAARRRRS